MEISRKTMDPKKVQAIPSERDLMNYAKTYLASYMETIDKEHPDDLPTFAKNAPYDIEIALLPNGCFCMLFQKSNKESMIVTDRDWNYVEGKVVSGMDHLLTVYAHEGSAVEDAKQKGAKDALTDVRVMESNEIAQASIHLESIVDELTNVAMANRASLKSIASQLTKLSPIKDAAKKGFPQSDMLRMVQGVKDYPAAPIEIMLDIPDKELLERLSKQLMESAELINRIEQQEELIEDLEERIKSSYDKLEGKINDKIEHGLAMVLTASDRKIDKGMSAISETAKGGGVSTDKIKEMTEQIDDLKIAVATASTRGGSSFMTDKLMDALGSDLTELKEKMGEMTMRVEVIEDYLMKISRMVRKTV